tara:strand:+ start:218 stop:790 length:573 start_codon:yes stop_codon:yes gene_type:complete
MTGQSINHSEVIDIKRKVMGIKMSGQIDHRTTEEKGWHYRHYDIGGSFPIAESWTAAIQYRSVYTLKDGNWVLEKRPHAQIQKTINTKAVKWAIKSRQEYRMKDGKDPGLRNRVRIMAKSNSSWKNLKPYIGNEFFYDMDINKYNKNRILIGFDLTQFEFGTPSIAFRHITTLADEKWKTTYTMIFKITF